VSVNNPTDRMLRAVADHLERYPNARDTAQGVRDWWLPADLRRTPVEEVERVLAAMVERGELEALPSASGETHFAQRRGTGGPRE